MVTFKARKTGRPPVGITYKSKKNFGAEELEKLFLSVQWESGQFPEKLVTAMQNSGAVFSAWDGDRLIGLINALDDGALTAYVHYLLVNPEHQGKGIGKELLRLVAEKYKDYLYIILISYDKEVSFYQNCGFSKADGTTPMAITAL